MNENKLPECKVIKSLIKRANERKDIDFRFLSVLEEFRIRVSEEVKFINQLFPEFTPHDEQFHLSQLFHIADLILGDKIIDNMSSSELLILSLSLYGHDWGMAVSNDEKNYIRNGAYPENYLPQLSYYIENENEDFKNYCNKNKIDLDEIDKTNIVWQDYLRHVHAYRSSERIRKYFEKIDGGLSDAVARICEGHCSPLEELQDYEKYPTDFSVLRENVNLRALTIYVRLIDLMDLGEDRTPYVIWKFVSPKNVIAKMEWNKHRALRPITTPDYLGGRIIRVDGNTDDHEVYAALMDLKDYCNQQFKESMDLLAQMSDRNNKLDIYHIDWRITARGFRPITIKFEFDRSRMFEILGSEIYRGDKRIFLRELLQNSIDAIRMRKEILEKQGIGSEKIGLIKIKIEKESENYSNIIWQDDGVGMDEYIIKNYLAVAGKSFYKSKDFSDLGIKMDPISRFGVGILSCFMVAESITIETYREPYLSKSSKPLRIQIPSLEKQFRIEELQVTNPKVGTTIKINLKSQETDNQGNHFEIKEIINYLRRIAGFVDYPIIIDDNGFLSAIINPYFDNNNLIDKFSKIDETFKLDLNYPVHESVFPPHQAYFSKYFQIQKFEVKKDLKLEEYHGAICIVTPIKEEYDITTTHFSYEGNYQELSVYNILRKKTEFVIKVLQSWTEIRQYQNMPQKLEDIGKSREQRQYDNLYGVYYKGIQVPEITVPEQFEDVQSHYEREFFIPYIKINIQNSSSFETDLSRFKIVQKKKSWDYDLYNSYCKYILDINKEKIIKSTPIDRLILLARLKQFYMISFEILYKNIPNEKWPLIMVQSDGKLVVQNWENITKESIYKFPVNYSWGKETKILLKSLLYEKLNNLYHPQWRGVPSIINQLDDNDSIILNGISHISTDFIYKKYTAKKILFLEPQYERKPPLIQEIMYIKNEEEPELVLENYLESLKSSEEIDPQLFNKLSRDLFQKYYNIFEIRVFDSPFENYFSYSLLVLNTKHRTTKKIIQIFVNLLYKKNEKDFLKTFWQWEDRITNLFEDNQKYEVFVKRLKTFFEESVLNSLCQINDINELIPSKKEIINDTLKNDNFISSEDISPLLLGKLNKKFSGQKYTV